MDIRHHTPQIGICGQISPDDIPALVKSGYRLLICNRPDGEEPGQPGFALIAAAARAAGIGALHLPVSGPADIAAQAPALAGALRNAPGPALLWCRSGARSSALCAAAGV